MIIFDSLVAEFVSLSFFLDFFLSILFLIHIVSHWIQFYALLFIVLLIVKTIVQVHTKGVVPFVLLSEIVQLTTKQGLHISKCLYLRVRVLIYKIYSFFMKLMEYCIDLSWRPFSFVWYFFSCWLKIPFTATSSSFEKSSKLCYLSLCVFSDRNKSIVDIEDHGKSFLKSKIIVIWQTFAIDDRPSCFHAEIGDKFG